MLFNVGTKDLDTLVPDALGLADEISPTFERYRLIEVKQS